MSTIGILTDKVERWWKKRLMKNKIARKVHALILIVEPKMIEILVKNGVEQKTAERIANEISVWMHECVDIVW